MNLKKGGGLMRRILLASGIVTALLLLNLTAVFACGDKTLRMGRGARFKRTGHTAAILIYIPADATATTLEKAPRLQSFLKKEGGHKVRIVQGADRLSEALDSGQYDVVLSSLGAAADVRKRVGSSASGPAVVPIAFKASKAEVAGAQKQYRYVVKDPNSGDDYLDAIEEVMILGWLSAEAARASRSKRCRRSSSSVNCAGSSFSATRRPSRVSCAR